MTDVRLTATNPEDSSVVPVACNSRGELLIEGSESSNNFPDGLTVGPDGGPAVTTLAADGRAEFGGDVSLDDNKSKLYIGKRTDYRWVDYTARINCIKQIPNNNVTGIRGFEIGASNDDAVNNGNYFRYGARYLNPGRFIIHGLKKGSSDHDDLIELANGITAFSGDVVIGSRGKQWMIVESNGLAHLVEQTRAGTADVASADLASADTADVASADLASADYPPLRDIPSELTMVEQQLQKVMERLKMAPEAGWEVWDGSD